MYICDLLICPRPGGDNGKVFYYPKSSEVGIFAIWNILHILMVWLIDHQPRLIWSICYDAYRCFKGQINMSLWCDIRQFSSFSLLLLSHLCDFTSLFILILIHLQKWRWLRRLVSLRRNWEESVDFFADILNIDGGACDRGSLWWSRSINYTFIFTFLSHVTVEFALQTLLGQVWAILAMIQAWPGTQHSFGSFHVHLSRNDTPFFSELNI